MNSSHLIPEIPKKDDPFLKKLIETIGITAAPVLVKIKPCPGAIVSECFPNVDKKIEKNGGTRIVGWQIWRTKNLIEAEFHAVWKSDKNVLIDITPKIVPMSEIMFIEDYIKKYEGKPVDNYRLNISSNSLVDDLIKVSETIFEIENRGSRANDHELRLGGEELQIWEILNEMKMHIPIMLSKGLTKNQKCYCGQDKYKKCHGKFLQLLHGL